MNILLAIGMLLIIGYTTGWLLDKIGLPKIVGYIATGVAFSPSTVDFIEHELLSTTELLMQVCLAFIAFEVGGALKWSNLKNHEKEIISITFMASLIPFVFIAGGIIVFGLFFPAILPLSSLDLLLLALLLGALASPTAPAATLAVIHQYKAKGKVTDTIIGVVALDDILGILLFSLTLSAVSIFTEEYGGLIGSRPVLDALYQIIVAVLVGAGAAMAIDFIADLFQVTGEGQWVVIIFSLIILCAGISVALQVDELLAYMTMGVITVNRCKQQEVIFGILERYTEDLIFLFFFLLSGLHLDISVLPQVAPLIVLFVVLRTLGKFLGSSLGARMVHADPLIRKYTAGGLLPQAGIVIGLVLNIYQEEGFKEISDILLTTVMGTTIIHELIGPVSAQYALMKSGEIKNTEHRTEI